MDANQPKRRRSDEPTREMSMEQTCMVCLRSFWSSREICGCPANYCSALVCSHCAVRSHEIGVVVKSERYTHVHWCVGCRRHRSKPDGGVPVVDVTRPRGGIHLRELAKRGIRTWSCGYGLYEWGSSQGEVFDNEDDCHAHMLVCGTKEVNCQYCGLAGTKKSLFETHMKFCHRKHYITPCTSCGLLQDARDMDGVHSYVCARGTTSCIVCGDEGAHTEPREDMMDHIERAHPGVGVINMTYSKGSIGQPIALGSFRVFLHRSLSTHTVFRTDKYELVISVSTRCPHLVGRTTLTPFFTRFPPICKADADDVIGYRFSVRTDLESFDNLPVFRFTSHPTSYPQDKLPSIEWNAVEIQDMRGYRDVYVMFEVSESDEASDPISAVTIGA